MTMKVTKPAPRKSQWEIDIEKRNALRAAFADEVADIEKRLRALSDKTMNGGVYSNISGEADAKNLNNAVHAVRNVRIIRRSKK